MKTAFIFLAGFLLLFAYAFIPPKHNLVGKWTIYESNGIPDKWYVEFKSDGTYNAFNDDGQNVEPGYYKLKHHVFLIRYAKDNVCGKDYWGKYRLDFHGDDSIHFTLIKDSCNFRITDILGTNPGLRRMKTN